MADKVEKLAHEVQPGDTVYSPNGSWLKVAWTEAWGADKFVLHTNDKTIAFTCSRYAKFDVVPGPNHRRVELFDQGEIGGGKKTYIVVAIKGTERTLVGSISSYYETKQQMHRTKGFESIARKTSYVKRWRYRAEGQGAPMGKGHETRKGAVAAMLRETQTFGADRSLNDQLADGAKVVKS